jgi:predicted dehydrogenase
MFGMPVRIYAEIPYGKYNDFSVDDEATITMRYSDNLTAVFILTTGEAAYEERLEIIGTKGKILLEDNVLHIYRYSEDSTEYLKKAEVNSRENIKVTEEIMQFDKIKEPYPEMLENFALAVIEGDSSLLVSPGADAVNPLMLTNAAYYSAWKEQPVTLPLDADTYYAEYQKHMEQQIAP